MPQSDIIHSRPFNRSPVNKTRNKPEKEEKDRLLESMSSQKGSNKNMSYEMRKKVIKKSKNSKNRALTIEGINKVEICEKYKKRLEEVKREDVYLGDLGFCDEVNALEVPDEPTGYATKVGTLQSPDLYNVEKVLSAPVISAVNISANLDQDDSISMKAIRPDYEPSFSGSISDIEALDPNKLFHDKLDHKKPDKNDMKFEEIDFGFNTKDKAAKKDSKQHTKVIFNVVWNKPVDGRLDICKLSDIQYDLKHKKKANFSATEDSMSYQRMTDIDRFFMQNFFKMSFRNITSEVYEFDNDMYKEDKAVFRRVA